MARLQPGSTPVTGPRGYMRSCASCVITTPIAAGRGFFSGGKATSPAKGPSSEGDT
jgi:hypothetical protein